MDDGKLKKKKKNRNSNTDMEKNIKKEQYTHLN